jgi:hypothetical protein
MIISDSVHDVPKLSQRSVCLYLDHLGWVHQTAADVGYDRIFGSFGRQLFTETCRFKKLIQFQVLRDATVMLVPAGEPTPELSDVLVNALLEGRKAEDEDAIELDDEMMVHVVETPTEEDLGEFDGDPDEVPGPVQEAIAPMLNVAQLALAHPSFPSSLPVAAAIIRAESQIRRTKQSVQRHENEASPGLPSNQSIAR